jgi:hypothetical protein
MVDPTLDPLAPLRAHGRREWRRFDTTGALPARIRVRVRVGKRQVGTRTAVNLSMGGALLALRLGDPRRLPVGEPLNFELMLAARPVFYLQGTCVHILCREGRFLNTWTAGIRFDTNLAYHTHRGSLAAYLLAVAAQEGAALEDAA